MTRHLVAGVDQRVNERLGLPWAAVGLLLLQACDYLSVDLFLSLGNRPEKHSGIATTQPAVLLRSSYRPWNHPEQYGGIATAALGSTWLSSIVASELP